MITYDCLYWALVAVATGEPEGRDEPFGPFARQGQPVGLLGKALARAGVPDLSEEDSPCVNSIRLLDVKAAAMAELVVQVLDAGKTYDQARIAAWTTFELMRRCELSEETDLFAYADPPIPEGESLRRCPRAQCSAKAA
ncbi:hypothetical protein [Crossiella sp. CA198]|uniref:hypothetical protein n=1 Tax=Crossiella sp. CA198 TaxID=3455607 RepID=UPI003F8D59B0